MAQKITNKEIKIGTVLKATHIEDDAPYELNRFYKASDIDTESYEGQISIEIDNHIGYSYFRSEIEKYFEIIDSIDDIEDLEHKALILKETFEQMKQMSESAEDEISDELLINETIAFLIQDEIYQCDEIELQFICNNMDITMVEQCSCCGKVLMPDDECYSDELNDNDAALCDHCSIYNDQTDMYQKSVHQDVIEKLTGYKFSPHLGNVGSKIEEFNYWLNKHEHKFGFKEPKSKDIFIEFINEYTEWNICDCCGLVEKSTELNWDDENLFDEEYQNFRFLQGTKIAFDAVCDDCLNKVNKRTFLSLEEITSRLIENQMLYRVSDYVILENVEFSKRNIVQNTIFGTIESLNKVNKTYKLKEFSGIDFKDVDFFDNLNEAYVNKYTDFIADNYPEKSDEVDEWSYPNSEGHADIEMAFENYGYKNEFIEYLKSNNLPYGRFLTPKFNIGDTFTVHFDYYDDNELTTHKISRIDTSFSEAVEIVYWSDEFVYITESELDKQKNQIKDEDEVLRDSILVFFFSDIAPTYSELIKAGEIKSNWQLSEEYENCDYSLVLEKVNERVVEFKEHLKALENVKSKRKYSIRTIVEYGVPIDIIYELQQLHNIYGNDNLSKVNQLILTQDSITTEDYSSIEILLDYETKYNELSLYLKSNLASNLHNEVDELIDVIIEAKADKYTTLHLYDC